MKIRSLGLYRAVGLGMAVTFAIVGGLFLFLPGGVIAFFNNLSDHLGISKAPLAERSFFGVLAVAYMYFVTLLAWCIYRAPGQKIYPLLLGHAKFASSFLSFGMFFFQAPLLIYLINGIVDAGLGILALVMFFGVQARTKERAL
jgi:hypothetical protein